MTATGHAGCAAPEAPSSTRAGVTSASLSSGT